MILNKPKQIPKYLKSSKERFMTSVWVQSPHIMKSDDWLVWLLRTNLSKKKNRKPIPSRELDLECGKVSRAGSVEVIDNSYWRKIITWLDWCRDWRPGDSSGPFGEPRLVMYYDRRDTVTKYHYRHHLVRDKNLSTGYLIHFVNKDKSLINLS